MSERPTPDTVRKEAGLLLLVGLWLLVGLFGHSPWKPDEGHVFGVVYSLLQDGDLVVPHLAGEPFVQQPPLYSATAAALAAAMSWLLPLHDGARLATAFYVAAAFAGIAAAGQALYGRKARWLPVLILGGCLGLWERAHQLQPWSAVLFGFALAALGLATADRRPIGAGVAIGSGIGVAFLATGLFGPLALAITALLLPAFRQWRTRNFAIALGAAALAALPWLAIWPAALHARSPELFTQWLWDENLLRMFGFRDPDAERQPWYLARNLPWIAWPAWPLVIWTLHLRWRGFGGGLMTAGIQMPVVMSLVTLGLLALAPDARAVNALPLLVPLALIGTAEIETLKRGHSAALDWFGILTWGVAAAVLWILWLQSTTTGMAPAIARLFKDAERGFVTPIQPLAVLLSLGLTALWIALVRPARRSNRRALLNWFAGSLLVWGLFSTLWLPYQESRRSYQPVARAVRVELPAESGCLASRDLGDAQRAALHYFAGLLTVREEIRRDHDCRYLLAQGTIRDGSASLTGWTKVWEGARPGDGSERFRLYRRDLQE